VEEKPASVEGEVRNSITLAPVERAHVSLRKTSAGNADRYGALTNAEGKFVIANVPPGNYALQMDRTAYVDLTAAPANQFRLSAGEKKEGLKLKLTPTGQITGRVLDADAAPMEGLSVSAESGGRSIRSASTDDRGMFRIGGIPPGKYRVLARLNNLPFPPEIRTDQTGTPNSSMISRQSFWL
jgi:protocatechuate 3,4-dioxygenase beta subunit